MKKVIDKSDSRGHSLYDWLDSHHTFSFDEYYNPRRMNFGALRVLNDDRVAPGKGFGEIEARKKIDYHMHQSHSGVYIFVMEGEVKVDGPVLSRRDGMGVYETGSFELETLKDSHILFIEVPM